VWGTYDSRSAGMFSEAAMAKLWEGVGKAAMTEIHKAQEGASGGVQSSHWW
jgi:hypothetical protein